MSQPQWLSVAWADLGTTERPGPAHNAKILSYYAEIGHASVADDETAWCAAFLGACLERAGFGSTRSLMARSYVDWGEPQTDFRHGAIAVLSRGADPTLGHVGFLVGETGDSLILLGGNQGDAVSVEAFPRERLLGLRWPVSEAASSNPVIPEGAPAPIRDPAPTITDIFDRSLAHVLQMEGGYSEDPYDPGGPTNFGITLATYSRYRGIELTAANFNSLRAELKTLPPDLVRRIYVERYWQPAHCPELPPPLALFHFDAAVNQGVAGAARMLQQALAVDIDGEIGPLTLAAAAARPIRPVLETYAEIRRRRYRALPHFWRFGRGWLRRVDITLARAVALAPAMPSVSTPQPKEPAPMSNPDTPTAGSPAASDPTGPIDTKWWAHSLTIWGIVVTTLSTVLPTLGPAFGFNITAELIRELGDNVVIFGQAAGGLIGTFLAIYGRLRATTPIERRQFLVKM